MGARYAHRPMLLSASRSDARDRVQTPPHGHRQRDAGLVLRRAATHPTSTARVAHGARAARGGRGPPRRRRRVRARRPAGGRRRGGDRARRAADRARWPASSARSSRSTRTSRRSPRRRSRRARRSSTTSPACATRRLADVCARDRRGARAHAHARGAEGDAARSRRTTTTSWPTSSRSCASGWTSRVARGVAAEQIAPRPGPGLRQDARADRRGAARGSTRCTRSGARSCWPSRARTSSARSPAARRASGWPGTLAAVGVRRRRGRADPARARRRARRRTSSRVRAVLRGERELGAGRGLSPSATPTALPLASDAS